MSRLLMIASAAVSTWWVWTLAPALVTVMVGLTIAVLTAWSLQDDAPPRLRLIVIALMLLVSLWAIPFQAHDGSALFIAIMFRVLLSVIPMQALLDVRRTRKQPFAKIDVVM